MLLYNNDNFTSDDLIKPSINVISRLQIKYKRASTSCKIRAYIKKIYTLKTNCSLNIRLIYVADQFSFILSV